MLTVKYIDLAGNETVFAAQEVRYSAEMQLDSDSPCGGHIVWFERPDAKAESGVLAGVSCGSVFVMNEAGKTVATYRLGDPSAKGCAAGVIGGNAPAPEIFSWSAGTAAVPPAAT